MSALAEHTRRNYRSIEELLSHTFRTASTAGRGSPEPLAAVLGISRGFGEYTPLEVATEAVNMRQLAMRSAGFMGKHILVALYAYPVQDSERAEELHSMTVLAGYCIGLNERLKDKHFVVDAVRDYCDKRMHHDYEWWAAHLGKHRRHIEYRWVKRSTEPGAKTIHNLLGQLSSGAHARVEEALERRNIDWGYA